MGIIYVKVSCRLTRNCWRMQVGPLTGEVPDIYSGSAARPGLVGGIYFHKSAREPAAANGAHIVRLPDLICGRNLLACSLAENLQKETRKINRKKSVASGPGQPSIAAYIAFINNKLCPKFALNNILCSRTGRDTRYELCCTENRLWHRRRLPAFSLLYLFFIWCWCWCRS